MTPLWATTPIQATSPIQAIQGQDPAPRDDFEWGRSSVGYVCRVLAFAGSGCGFDYVHQLSQYLGVELVGQFDLADHPLLLPLVELLAQYVES